MTNKFNLNKFNSFLDMASKTIACGPECQQEKTAEELKNKYLTAQSNLTLAEPQYQIAKQNYYTFVSGQNGYDDMIEGELQEKAELIANNFKDDYDDKINKIKTQLDTYNGILINFRNIVDLYKQYKIENNGLTKQLKEEANDILTNERKTYYQDQEISSLNNYYYYFLLTLYIIVVICYAIFSLIYPSQFNWKVRLFLLVLFLVLPFISTFLLGKIIWLIYWIFGLLPKNVYK